MKRTMVATLMLATLGGCRMPDEGPDMPPIARPSSSRATTDSTSYYNRTSWKGSDREESSEDDLDSGSRPRRTVQSGGAANRRTVASVGRDSTRPGYCRQDDGDVRLNDPVSRNLVQATMTRTDSTTGARTASRSVTQADYDSPAPRRSAQADYDSPAPRRVAQADYDAPPPRRRMDADYDPPAPRRVAQSDYDPSMPRHSETWSYSRRPAALPSDMQRATPLGSSVPAPMPSSRLTQAGTMTPASLSRAAATRASGGKLSLVNSKRIRLRYAADRFMTASSSGVEVWGTRDMRTWKRYPLVSESDLRTAEGRSDTTASCLVEVEGEGVYGFTLCGVRGPCRPPQAGDTPQMWVAVDTTRPSVRLVSSEVQDQDSGRKVVVRWTAQDANLGDHPIALSYAHKPGGPWTTIAGSLSNTGRYEWNLPPQVGSFVHLRVQATDMMGNMGSAEATNPLYVREREALETRGSAGLPPAINTQPAMPTASASSESGQPELMGASGDDR